MHLTSKTHRNGRHHGWHGGRMLRCHICPADHVLVTVHLGNETSSLQDIDDVVDSPFARRKVDRRVVEVQSTVWLRTQHSEKALREHQEGR